MRLGINHELQSPVATPADGLPQPEICLGSPYRADARPKDPTASKGVGISSLMKDTGMNHGRDWGYRQGRVLGNQVVVHHP